MFASPAPAEYGRWESNSLVTRWCQVRSSLSKLWIWEIHFLAFRVSNYFVNNFFRGELPRRDRWETSMVKPTKTSVFNSMALPQSEWEYNLSDTVETFGSTAEMVRMVSIFLSSGVHTSSPSFSFKQQSRHHYDVILQMQMSWQ